MAEEVGWGVMVGDMGGGERKEDRGYRRGGRRGGKGWGSAKGGSAKGLSEHGGRLGIWGLYKENASRIYEKRMVWGLLSDGDGWRLSKDGGNLGFNKGEGIGAYEKMWESCGLSNGGKLLSIKWGKVGGLSNEKGFGVSNEKGFGVYQKKGESWG